MIDFYATQVRGHRRNIERYCRLLATDLTELERQYLHKRIAEEHAQLERLEKRQGKREDAMVAEAAEELTRGQWECDIHAGTGGVECARSWEFLSPPNCAAEVLVHTRRPLIRPLSPNLAENHIRT